MANELDADRFSGLTVFACRFTEAGLVFLTDGSAAELWGTAGRTAADYAVAMTEKNTLAGASGHYVGDFDASGNIAAGIYKVGFYEQAGGSPADTDIPAFQRAEMDWTGTAEIFRSTLHDILEGDIEIDTAQTPWQMVVKKRGTSTELMRKDLKDTAAANITAVTSVVGSIKDP
jgi:hypothetical protein